MSNISISFLLLKNTIKHKTKSNLPTHQAARHHLAQHSACLAVLRCGNSPTTNDPLSRLSPKLRRRPWSKKILAYRQQTLKEIVPVEVEKTISSGQDGVISLMGITITDQPIVTTEDFFSFHALSALGINRY